MILLVITSTEEKDLINYYLSETLRTVNIATNTNPLFIISAINRFGVSYFLKNVIYYKRNIVIIRMYVSVCGTCLPFINVRTKSERERDNTVPLLKFVRYHVTHVFVWLRYRVHSFITRAGH